jgi:hypothetical protein
MKQVIRIIILCLSALPFVGMEVRAENAGPCAGDIAKFCKEVQFGGGRIMNCLKEHDQELSGACRDHQLVMIKKLKDAPQVCQDDVEQFCRQVRPENRRILRCLKQNEAHLSTECAGRMKDVN